MLRSTVFLRDSNRVLRGPLPVLTGEAVLRLNGVGSWRFDMDGTSPKAQRMGRGGGVFAVDDETNQPLLNGPTTSLLNAADADGPGRTLTAAGVTDEQHLFDRTMYPSPGLAVTAQTATARYNASGVGSTVMRTAVNVQAGPGALLARRVAGLIMEADPLIGTNVILSVRLKPNLGETIAELAAISGLAWTIVQVGTDLVFRISVPRDLTRRARFSREMANLGAYAHSDAAPTVTHAAVLGQGEGTLRVVKERSNVSASVTAWGRRIEDSLDRRDTDTDLVLQQAGDEALLEGAPSSTVEVDPIDLPRLRYGRDYRLGDRVSVELGGGLTISDVVRQVTLTWGPAGVSSRPLIGPESARDFREPPTFRAIRNLKKNLGRLEAGK